VNLFLSAVGLLLILEGAPYFAAPDRMKALMAQVSEAPPSVLRLMGLLAMAAGAAVLYLARRTLAA
jgi:uncharacterized protein YjeT (DUF2065 family)